MPDVGYGQGRGSSMNEADIKHAAEELGSMAVKLLDIAQSFGIEIERILDEIPRDRETRSRPGDEGGLPDNYTPPRGGGGGGVTSGFASESISGSGKLSADSKFAALGG